MPKIVFRSTGGAAHPVEAAEGMSVMEAAMLAGVDGVVAECGGNITCSTCHVYIDPGQSTSELDSMSEDEAELLDLVAAERRTTSRLSCQIIVTAGLDGLVVGLPERQI